MQLGKKIDLFGVMAVLLFGAVLGGGLTYQEMDSRIGNLEQKVSANDSVKEIVYVNSTENGLSEVYDKVEASVVSIRASGTESSEGSGFIYNRRGHIVTNEHVIEGATSVEVTFTDGERKTAEIVGTDPYTDLAVLKVDKSGLEPLDIADSTQVEEGQDAVAIGNPFGLRSSMTKGIISAKGRTIRVTQGFSIPNVLQTDAAINPGNSGGPLLNKYGEVVGVNTAIDTQTGTFSGVGFAVTSNTVQRVAPKIIAQGDYNHPYIGIRGLNVGPVIAEEMGLERNSGFLITEIPNGTAADGTGLRGGQYQGELQGQNLNLGGDVIVAINDTEVRSLQDVLTFLAREASVGDKVELTVIRDGEERKFTLTLGSRPETN